MKFFRTLAASTALLAISAAASFAAQDKGSAAKPIKVGAISSLSGPATFPEATQAAQAVFDRFNKAGGLDGRKIEYTVVDDKADPSTAGAAARQLVSSEEVVALVGSSSLLECQVNGAYYKREQVPSLQGVGTDPVCFTNPMFAPAVLGPYADSQLSLQYGSEVLNLKRICALVTTTGSMAPAYRDAVKKWSASTGKTLAYYDDTLPYGLGDYTPFIVKAMANNCDGVFLALIEPDAIGALKAAQAQGWNNVTFLSQTTVYSDSFAKAASGMVGKGLYVPSEFAPYMDLDSANTADWRELMQKNNIPLTSFGQAGYLAATNFITVLKSIKGDVTRASVLAALKAAKPISNPMVGTPWEFRNDANRSGWPVVLMPGASKWTSAGDGWVHLR